jgi:hypothetical protein
MAPVSPRSMTDEPDPAGGDGQTAAAVARRSAFAMVNGHLLRRGMAVRVAAGRVRARLTARRFARCSWLVPVVSRRGAWIRADPCGPANGAGPGQRPGCSVTANWLGQSRPLRGGMALLAPLPPLVPPDGSGRVTPCPSTSRIATTRTLAACQCAHPPHTVHCRGIDPALACEYCGMSEHLDRSVARIELADLRRLAELAADAEAELFGAKPARFGPVCRPSTGPSAVPGRRRALCRPAERCQGLRCLVLLRRA